MENPFKNIIENQQVPEILRERVMNDVNIIKLSLDMADLFAVKNPSSIFNLIDTSSKNKKDSDQSDKK